MVQNIYTTFTKYNDYIQNTNTIVNQLMKIDSITVL